MRIVLIQCVEQCAREDHAIVVPQRHPQHIGVAGCLLHAELVGCVIAELNVLLAVVALAHDAEREAGGGFIGVGVEVEVAEGEVLAAGAPETTATTAATI